jgi:hypothetical protein
MDGTIVCSLHRYRTTKTEEGREVIDLQYWRDNEHKAYEDDLLPLAEQYQRDLQDPSCYVVIATARVLGEADRRFIADKLGNPDYIISRKDGETTSGGLMKIRGLVKFFNLKNFVEAARNAVFYEDNATYLKAVCDRFSIRGVYVPSRQGH